MLLNRVEFVSLLIDSGANISSIDLDSLYKNCYLQHGAGAGGLRSLHYLPYFLGLSRSNMHQHHNPHAANTLISVEPRLPKYQQTQSAKFSKQAIGNTGVMPISSPSAYSNSKHAQQRGHALDHSRTEPW